MFTINAELRTDQGKSASRRLRHAGKFPAIIYGGDKEPVNVVLDHNQVFNMQQKAEFYSEVLTISINGKEEKVKIQAIQRHPVRVKLMHMDFVRV